MATYLRERGTLTPRRVLVESRTENMRRSNPEPRRQWSRSWANNDENDAAESPKISILEDPYYAQTDSEDDEMAGPGLDWPMVQEIIGSTDERFEAVVNSLNMREMLDLVSGLQSSMAEEQQRFDDLRVRLDLLGPGHLEGPEGETLSVALCSSQMRLARLCARNMRCFTQQAVRAKQNHRIISEDADSRTSSNSILSSGTSSTITTNNGLSKPTLNTNSPDSEIYPVVIRRNSADRLLDDNQDEEVINKSDSPVRAVGFKERLRFFQQQESNGGGGGASSVSAQNGGGTRKTWSSSGEWTPAARRGEATVLDEDDAATTITSTTRDNSDALSDFRTRSESDFDVSDFVVHRTTFAEDLDDAYDSCSAVEEESVVSGSGSTPVTSPVRIIKVEIEDRTENVVSSTPKGIDLHGHLSHDDEGLNDLDGHGDSPLVEQPSSDPDDDFVEQERELQKRQSGLARDENAGDAEGHESEEGGGGTETEEESEEDFVDNSASYMAADPRRYVYYTDENELEVILEEPEEEAEAEMLQQQQEENYQDDEDDEDEDSSDSDARSSTVDSVVQRIIPSTTEAQKLINHEEDLATETKVSINGNSQSRKTENGISSDDDSIKSPTSLGGGLFGKEDNHDDSGVAEDHPSSSSAAEELDDPLSPCSSLDHKLNGSNLIVKGFESPDPLPRLEENIFTSNLEVPLVPPRPLPNYIPVNGYHKKQEIKEKNDQDRDETPPALPSTPPPKIPSQSPPTQVKQSPEIKPKSNGHVTFSAKDSNEDEVITTNRPRSTTLSWDPSDLLAELYKTPQINERSDCRNVSYPGERPVMMEGYLEKLPTGKRKSTYWNSWKRKYFKVFDGHLHCYDSSYSEEPRMSLLLMGGTLERLDDKVVGLDDRKGHYLVLRCHSVTDTDDWFDVLSWHCQENFDATYVHPVAYPLPSRKKIVIIDLGGCSTRAGILMDQPTLPQVYFPNVCASNKVNSQKKVFGSEALVPYTRQQSVISFPIQPTAKISKYTLDVDSLPVLFKKVFTELNMDPSLYTVALCVPRTLSPQTQLAITKMLLEDFGAQGVNMTHQALLTLYAYRSTSGVVVDVGDRLDIVPVSEGYIVENGITRLPYGGRRIAHHLNHTLAHKQISLLSDVESFLLRYLLEQSCYVAQNYDEEVERCRYDPESVEKVIPVDKFLQDNPPFKSVTMEFGRFHAPEGLFNPKLWGLDSPGLAKLVHKAIQECGMDVRKEMARSIFLSGGVTCLPGFAQRLEKEIDKLTPNSVIPKVHASPYRQHMAFLGACQMSLSNEFQRVCISREEWMTSSNNQRASLINRWHL